MIDRPNLKAEPYTLYNVDVQGTVPAHFRDTIIKRMESMISDFENKRLKYRGFFEVNRNIGDVLVIPDKEVPDLSLILEQARQHEELDECPDDLNTLRRVWGYAVALENKNERLIFFRKYTDSKVIGKERKGKGSLFKAEYHKGRLKDVSGEVLVFDEWVDAIYIQSAEKVLVLDWGKFETMFDFREYYKQESKKAIESLLANKVLVISDMDVIEKAIEKPRISTKVTRLYKEGVFARIESGDISMKYFSDYKTRLPGILKYDVNDGKVVVNDHESFQGFLDACEQRYLGALASFSTEDKPNIYRADFKEKVTGT